MGDSGGEDRLMLEILNDSIEAYLSDKYHFRRAGVHRVICRFLFMPTYLVSRSESFEERNIGFTSVREADTCSEADYLSYVLVRYAYILSLRGKYVPGCLISGYHHRPQTSQYEYKHLCVYISIPLRTSCRSVLRLVVPPNYEADSVYLS